MSISRNWRNAKGEEFTRNSSNTTGLRLKECPLEVLNRYIIVKLQRHEEGKIAIPDSAKLAGSQNSAIVIGVGGDVLNKEWLLGKHIVFAKFRYAEPFPFKNEQGILEEHFIITDDDIVGVFVDQSKSAVYMKINQPPTNSGKIKV